MTEQKHTLIIAEAGVNHNGSLELALRLVDEAVNAGADIVKFQTFKASKLVSSSAGRAEYQKKNTGNDDTQLAMLKKLELSEADHHAIIEHCRKKGIRFLSTPFDADSAAMLKEMGVTTGKIPSGEMTNLLYLRMMAENFPEIIMSTGMCTMKEIGEALEVVLAAGTSKENITILHCNTEYPTPLVDVNLRAMTSIQKQFGTHIGYSDHTDGILVPVAAVAMGATVIEKHFTLSRQMEGPDHAASLEPAELKEMVKQIRQVEIMMGSDQKLPSPSEIKNIPVARRSVVAKRPLQAGHILTMDDMDVKRPGTGISPMKIEQLIGKALRSPIGEDEVFTDEHVRL